MSNNRKDVLAKVTGRAVYANDIQMPNMVFCKVVRSTIASGRIRSIDCSEAEKMPGVVRIFTAKDIPGIPNQPCDRPVICGDRVRYIGDAVALVAAETRQQADEAAKLVKVEYEELPANFDPMHALDEDAPLSTRAATPSVSGRPSGAMWSLPSRSATASWSGTM